MNLKARITELLKSLEQFYHHIENFLDDMEKTTYLPKIREHQNYINQIKEKLNEINSATEEGIKKLVSIHSEVLNKYFS